MSTLCTLIISARDLMRSGTIIGFQHYKLKMASKKKTKTRVKEKLDLDVKIISELGGDKVIYFNLDA
jgi:hypothetical protein